MFSQWRNVVENLAQPTPQRANSQSPERAERPPHQPRNSFDLNGRTAAHAAGGLAETALSNLRRSLAAQRPYTVGSPDSNAGRASPQRDRELRPLTSKSTLEERLRASFSIGDVSTATTPESASQAPTPSPKPPAAEEALSAESHILSPSSTPLPESPVSLPLQLLAPQALQDAQRISSTSHENQRHDSSTQLDTNPSPSNLSGVLVRAEAISVNDQRLGVDIPLPLSPEPDSPSRANDASLNDLTAPSANSSFTSSAVPTDSPAQSEEIGNATALNGYRDLEARLDSLLSEHTPIKSVRDIDDLQGFLVQVGQQAEEIKRLNGRSQTFDERLEEIRDTHRLESRSQNDLVNLLRRQLEESETLMKAEQLGLSKANEELRLKTQELEQLRSDSQKFKETAKDEEEKRVKAISLLKTVRQKLVKAEKDREEALKEVTELKEREKSVRDEEGLEKAKLRDELEFLRETKQKDVMGLKAHFDRELLGMKEKLENEFLARKGQYELEASVNRASLQKDITQKKSRIQSLEVSVRSLTAERDSLFDQLQLRQAELESSQSHLEMQQSGASELQFRLREAEERVGLATEELADVRRELEYRTYTPPAKKEEILSSAASIEAKNEARLEEFRARVADLERDRNATELEMNRTLAAKIQEIDNLKAMVESFSSTRESSESELAALRSTIENLSQEVALSKIQLQDVRATEQKVKDLESIVLKLSNDLSSRTEQYESQMSEFKEKETSLKASNKALRDDLRKVQNSASLLERQRNPGVGHWSSFSSQRTSSETRLPSKSNASSDINSASRTASPTPSIPTLPMEDDELNLEYIRNVVLQFLEHKEMRPHLVKVLAIILHFTPQETRRLVAKV